MHSIQIISLLSTLFYILLIIAGYIIKRSIIKVLESNDSLKPDQISNLKTVINVIYYTIAIVLLGMILYPYIVSLSFN
ncbi:hypothetical protein HHA03_25170 [Halolactibacillus halophilus]|uniref:Uncharacterized protein n=1 Tax=Halolactibacillus halophilus TaxID=306540 RepID=A0ABQ0VR82_9BACI|nr:hypothetical protein HHA03_25170 [Halolactibacillus halophilus]